MKLIQNIDVYAPQHLGKKDVLIINDKIVKIKDAGSISADGFLSEAEMINGEGLLLTPDSLIVMFMYSEAVEKADSPIVLRKQPWKDLRSLE